MRTSDVAAAVAQGTLAGKILAQETVVILEPRVAVELRVHPGEVIGLAVVLDRELPVAPRHEA